MRGIHALRLVCVPAIALLALAAVGQPARQLSAHGATQLEKIFPGYGLARNDWVGVM